METNPVIKKATIMNSTYTQPNVKPETNFSFTGIPIIPVNIFPTMQQQNITDMKAFYSTTTADSSLTGTTTAEIQQTNACKGIITNGQQTAAHSRRKVKWLMASLVLLMVIMQGRAWGQGTLGSYSTQGLTGASASISASSVASNVSFSTFTRGNGITAVSVSNAFRSSGFATGTGGLNTGNNDYLEFTITPASCYSVSLTAIRFDLIITTSAGGGSNGGPTTVALRSSLDSYANTISTNTTSTTLSTESFDVSSLPNITGPVTFRLYGYNAETTAGTLTVQNINNTNDLGVEVDGTVVINAPAQPSAITGNTAPCLGSTETYSVSSVGGVTYTWTLPNGWSGSSMSNSIIVTVGSGSGDILVTPANSCGGGTAQTLAVTPIILTTQGAIICQGGSGNLTATANCPAGVSDSKGPNNAGAGANVTEIGTIAWTGSSNITTIGTPYATSSVTGGSITNYLRATNYGFAIPENSTINGIKVDINRTGTSPASGFGIFDNTLFLVKDASGVPVIQTTGSDKASTGTVWPTSLTVASYGGANDLWNLSWSATDINNGNFGVALSVNANGSQAKTATVDYMQITVYYTTADGTIEWYTTSVGGTSIGSGSSFSPVGVLNSGLPNTNTPGTTTFYAACSNSSDCRTAADFVIKALPVVGFTAMAAEYCSNDATVALTGNHAPAGSFSGAGITDNGDGTAIFDPATAGEGIHAIIYTYTDPITNCPNTATQNVTVNLIPAITDQAIDRSICEGDNTTFGITATGTGIGYQWQVDEGSGFTPLANVAPYSGVATSTLTITGVTNDMNGYKYQCFVFGACPPAATSDPKTLTVNPLPGVTGTLNVCAESTTQLSGSFTPADPIAWISSATDKATVDNTGLVTGVSAGSADITYTDINGCSKTVTVVVNAKPIITGTMDVCQLFTTQLSGSGTPADPTHGNQHQLLCYSRQFWFGIRNSSRKQPDNLYRY